MDNSSLLNKPSFSLESSGPFISFRILLAFHDPERGFYITSVICGPGLIDDPTSLSELHRTYSIDERTSGGRNALMRCCNVIYDNMSDVLYVPRNTAPYAGLQAHSFAALFCGIGGLAPDLGEYTATVTLTLDGVILHTTHGWLAGSYQVYAEGDEPVSFYDVSIKLREIFNIGGPDLMPPGMLGYDMN